MTAAIVAPMRLRARAPLQEKPASPEPERAFSALAADATRAHVIAVLAEKALDRWPSGPLRPAVLGTAATARLVTGDVEAAAEHADRALELDPGALIALRVHGLLQLSGGDLPEALAVLSDVGARARRAGDLVLAIDAEGFVAQALEAIGRHDAAEELAARLRADARPLGLTSRLWAHYVSGAVTLAWDPIGARRRFDAAAATVPLGCRHDVARLIVRGRGVAAVLEGEVDDGAALLLDALDRYEVTGDVRQQAITLMAIALLLAESDRCELAAELASAADRARTAAPLDVLEWVVVARAATRLDRLAAGRSPRRRACPRRDAGPARGARDRPRRAGLAPVNPGRLAPVSATWEGRSDRSPSPVR